MAALLISQPLDCIAGREICLVGGYDALYVHAVTVGHCTIIGVLFGTWCFCAVRRGRRGWSVVSLYCERVVFWSLLADSPTNSRADGLKGPRKSNWVVELLIG